jgi:CO/xanthine dehydrogenase Mo-binding subunit
LPKWRWITETGEVNIIKIVIVNDSGRAINPMIVRANRGRISPGTGLFPVGEPVIDSKTGRVLTDDFDTYKIASAVDMPEMEVNTS